MIAKSMTRIPGQQDLNDLLEKWSIWLIQQNPDAGDDATGVIVATRNGNNPIWYIPGTWGKRQASPRNLRVAKGKSLFIVLASSHATKEELKAGDAPSQANLARLADEIDDWDQASLTIDGNDFTGMLKRAETRKFPVSIPAGSFYAGLINPRATTAINTEMVSIGHVFLLKVDSKVGTKHTIEMHAHSPQMTPQHGKFPELDYSMSVQYVVQVT